MQTNDFSNLPTSWQIKTLGEVCEITMGQSPLGEKVINKKQNTNSKALEFHQGKICFTDKFITESEVVTTDIRKVAQSNSILLCVRAPVGVINITQRQIAIGRGLCALNFKDKNSNNDFLYFYLLTLKNYFNEKATGSTFSAINLDTIKNTKIPLPPLEIQKRIVARLESAFEKIEKGSAHLQDAKTKLAKYKQSLLKSAFNGTLFCHTEGEARSISNQESRDISLTLNMTNSLSLRASVASVAIQNNDTIKAIDCHSPNGLRNDSTHSSLRESAADETIHKVDCHKSANANFHNDDKSVDCHDLTSSNLAMTDKENPKLPQGWTIKTLGEVFKVVGGGTPSTAKTEFWNGNIAWITSADIDLQSFIITPKRFITNEAIQSSTTNCVEKDTIIVVTRVGLGKVGITDRQTCFSQDSQALIPLENINVKFMAFQIKNQAKNFISVSRGTTINGITKNILKELKLVVPPLEIQKQIVKLLEKHLQHADKMGEFIESALNKAKQLKQSLLKSAFLGKLT